MLYVNGVSFDLNLTSRVSSGHSGFLLRQKLTPSLFQSSILKKMAPRVAFWVDRHNCVNKLDVTQLRFHPDTHLDYVSDTPFRCAVFRCPHKSWVHKNLTFISSPTDPKLKQKWVAALEARTMDYKWQSKHRVCSAHYTAMPFYGPTPSSAHCQI